MTILRRSQLTIRPTFRRSYGTSSHKPTKLTIGIRREDPLRIWERRCPLTPDAVHDLVHRDGVEVLVQPCERRVFTANDFLKAGAKLHSSLQPAHILVGIKETPLPEVLTDPLPAPSSPRHHVADWNGDAPLVPRTHVMFSHTIKGQLYNMELLAKFLASENASAPERGALLPKLVDYELLVGEHGKRTVGFGWFAGVAGALEALCAMAHAHLELGVASPLLWTPRPHTHPSLASIRSTLRNVVGAQIASNGTPQSLGPLVIGVTGTGKVAEGALALLEDLPIQHIRVDQLPSIVTDPTTDLHKIYVVHAHAKDYFVRRDGGAYDRSDYYAHPDQYVSEFHTKIAPYLSLLLHGAGWAPAFPRLMTNEQLTTTLEIAQTLGKGRFACVGDISCDVGGGLEFLSRHTTLSAPYFVARPPTLPAHLPSVTMMAVDILPTALPLEASQHFSQAFLPYLRDIVSRYTLPGGSATKTQEGAALERATVASAGELSASFQWLREPLGVWKESVPDSAPSSAASGSVPAQEKSRAQGIQPKKNVLMLGSGMVAPPAVAEICSRPDVRLVVASNVLADAERLTAPYPNAIPKLIDMGDLAAVERLVAEADVVISLLPVTFHPSVAELCIKNSKHLVTASYISPAMHQLHDRAVAADVILMNEIGLDPGIDHCSALSLIDSLRAQQKEIVSFTSFCGGLPAPEDAEVPLGYKFSWSPRGVLTAALNSARFKLDGQVCEIRGEDLLKTYFPAVPVSPVLKFEGLANRDSLPYAQTYGLEPLANVRTLFRGTLRYPGYADLMHAFRALGLLETSTTIVAGSWDALVRHALAAKLGTPIADDPASLHSALAEVLAPAQYERVVQALHWLSIVPAALSPSADSTPARDSIRLPPLPPTPAAPLDLFAALLAHKLQYAPHERDLVVLSHEIVTRPSQSAAEAAGDSEEEVHTSSLVTYGIRSASAMARTVGLPVACAALLVLDGGVRARGVQGPAAREVYTHVLQRLGEAGLRVQESSRRVRRIERAGEVGSVEEALGRRWREMRS